MVYRIFVERKKGFQNEAKALKSDLVTLMGLDKLEKVRVANRYDVEGIDAPLFNTAISGVFSQPQLDEASSVFAADGAAAVFGVEPLPGQFDQRADSAAQCIQLISKKDKPLVKTAKIYALYGDLSAAEVEKIKNYVINPVESREASMSLPETLKVKYEIPTEVETLYGFNALDENGLKEFLSKYALAMDGADIAFCQRYFKSENREPTLTEIRMLDTYWSDHCRHTTFLTTIDKVEFESEAVRRTYGEYLDARRELGRQDKPVNFMDIATIGAKLLKKRGLLKRLDESEEINACSVKITVNIDGKNEDWLLLFKNETHNHPTEIEPFGGAATCIGGAIRDPLSGRAYVYAAMRVTGAGNPLAPVGETLKGKLPQRKIVTGAAEGYSSYGNQIGLATGIVDEIYHEGYVAKRLEIGAVIGAAPAKNVRREVPAEGDVVILLGGKTGRDGCGGATGSSKAHSIQSLSHCGAEVQKGNAPEERKLQRLFRNPQASRLIKRCNDFGAGGVSVAIGELADGLEINLNAVPRKYDGLDGTELAISESQERMAVVVSAEDKDRFIKLAYDENLEATPVAVVSKEARLKMVWNGKVIADVSREFLNSNGAEKFASARVAAPEVFDRENCGCFRCGLKELASDLNCCSKRGLSERFDSTIGAGAVNMPYGGKYQATPVQAMATKISLENGETDDCSLMSWGYNPNISEKSPFHGAYFAVVESVAKLVASGANLKDTYLTLQEYFARPKTSPERWGKPLAALLGAYKAQTALGIAAIGGKDSMSGSFENIDVPPTLVSFAVTTTKAADVISPEFKKAGREVAFLKTPLDKDGLPDAEAFKRNAETVAALIKDKKVVSAYTPAFGGIAEAVMKMTFGNRVGFAFDSGVSCEEIFAYNYGSFVLELADGCTVKNLSDGSDYAAFKDARILGATVESQAIRYLNDSIGISELLRISEEKLESVYACNIQQEKSDIPLVSYENGKKQTSAIKFAKPRFLIPVFAGTNCEYDTAKAIRRAGGEAEIFIVNSLSAKSVEESVRQFSKKLEQAQAVFIPGGFSGGDEPDGSGKFITAFFRNAAIKDKVHELLKFRDGLMGGICNGFQALIKLGLVPFGEIVDSVKSDYPTLTYNTISRHQSMIVKTRVASNLSPWLARVKVGDVFNVPISHGEGRFVANDFWIRKLIENGQIATQYVDFDDRPSFEVRFNPNDSVCAVEGITSPDGRVIGKMGHSERIGDNLYKNVAGDYDIKLFESAVDYFS
jgi:phosphoribosylformylglycinamidine synthase